MSHIALKAKRVDDMFHRLAGELQNGDFQDQNSHSITEAEVSDTLGMYRIWAGNIGAFQPAELKSSLAYRIRDAHKVAAQIAELLDEIAESLDDGCQIVSKVRENRTGSLSSDTESLVAPHESEDSDPEEGTSEIREIFASIDDAVKNLFRLSIIIRNNTTRDRYSQAASAAMTSPFNDQFDIDHVRHKFPELEKAGKLWLVRRLGRSITHRRHFLRYCREHHMKIAKDASKVELPFLSREDGVLPVASRLAPTAKSEISKPTSTLAPTQASTLVLTSGQSLEEETIEDNQSQTSYATSTEEETGNGKLSVIALEDVSRQERHFECPYCWQIQAINNQKSWKKHVFSDLKPYVCTFEECDLKMFSDRHTWLAHELDHQQKLRCYFCTSNHIFTKSADYQKHLEHAHTQSFIATQLPTLLQLSRQPITRMSPSDCSLCDDWEERLRIINPHVPSSESLVVTLSQFERNLGEHMEQLALFAIPRGTDGEADSGNAAHQPGSECSSLDLSFPDPSTAERLRLCEEILNDMMSMPSAEGFRTLPRMRPVSLRLPNQKTIKTPSLDLSIISQKLQGGAYSNSEEFQLDVILMFAFVRAFSISETDLLPLHDIEKFFMDFWGDGIPYKHLEFDFLSTLAQFSKQIRWKWWMAASLPLEPSPFSLESSEIRFKMPDDKIMTRRFPKRSNVEHLYAFVECYDMIVEASPLRKVQQLQPVNYIHEYRFRLRVPTTGILCDANLQGTIGDVLGEYVDLSVESLNADEPPLVGARPMNQSTDPNNATVFVGGLSGVVTEDELRSFFEGFGEITYVKIPPGKGCGFVKFVQRHAAEMAINQMQGYPIGGSYILLSWDRSQNNSNPTGAPDRPAPPQISLMTTQGLALDQQAGGERPLNSPYPDHPDQKLLEALESPKDRAFLILIEEELINFVKSTKEIVRDLPPTNSFARILLHKLADYYHLTHQVDAADGSVRIFRTPFSRLPPPLADIYPLIQPFDKTATIATIPAKLKSADLTRFILKASQLETVKPVIAYWCNYWIVNQILSKGLHNGDPETLQYTTTLMDKLEQIKAESATNEAIVYDTTGQAYVKHFARETFLKADRDVKDNVVTKQTSDTFYAAATFLGLINIWEDPDSETQARIKYAKWNALRIMRAIKEGKDPNESNPELEIEPEEAYPAFEPEDPEDIQYQTLEQTFDKDETVDATPDEGSGPAFSGSPVRSRSIVLPTLMEEEPRDNIEGSLAEKTGLGGQELHQQIAQLVSRLENCDNLCRTIRTNRRLAPATDALDALHRDFSNSATNINSHFQTLRSKFGSRVNLGDVVSRANLNHCIQELQLTIHPDLWAMAYGHQETGPGFRKLHERWINIYFEVSKTLDSLGHRLTAGQETITSKISSSSIEDPQAVPDSGSEDGSEVDDFNRDALWRLMQPPLPTLNDPLIGSARAQSEFTVHDLDSSISQAQNMANSCKDRDVRSAMYIFVQIAAKVKTCFLMLKEPKKDKLPFDTLNQENGKREAEFNLLLADFMSQAQNMHTLNLDYFTRYNYLLAQTHLQRSVGEKDLAIWITDQLSPMMEKLYSYERRIDVFSQELFQLLPTAPRASQRARSFSPVSRRRVNIDHTFDQSEEDSVGLHGMPPSLHDTPGVNLPSVEEAEFRRSARHQNLELRKKTLEMLKKPLDLQTSTTFEGDSLLDPDLRDLDLADTSVQTPQDKMAGKQAVREMIELEAERDAIRAEHRNAREWATLLPRTVTSRYGGSSSTKFDFDSKDDQSQRDSQIGKAPGLAKQSQNDARYTLPCDLVFVGCEVAFPSHLFNDWIDHSLTHFEPAGPPEKAICIFCNLDEAVFKDKDNKVKNWRSRMLHIAEHFENGMTLEDSRPDFFVIEYMHSKGLLSSEDYKSLTQYTERPQVKGLGITERPKDMGMLGGVRRDDIRLQVYDQSKEDRERRGKKKPSKG